MHITTQKIYKIISTVVIVVAVFVASYAFATLSSGPTQNPPAGNRSPFLNTGPIEQIKLGRLDIGGSPSADVAFSVTGGVANLIGGIHVSNTTATSATVDAPMYIGYSGTGVTGTPATLSINNRLHVSGTVRDGSLAHAGNTPAPVCADADGVLVACTPITITTAPSCLIRNFPGSTAMGTHDTIECTKITDSSGTPVVQYELRGYNPWWGIIPGLNTQPPVYVDYGSQNIPATWHTMGLVDITGMWLNSPTFRFSYSNNFTPAVYSYPYIVPATQGSPSYTSDDIHHIFWGYKNDNRMSVRGISGNVTGPWGDFNTVIPGPGQTLNN